MCYRYNNDNDSNDNRCDIFNVIKYFVVHHLEVL